MLYSEVQTTETDLRLKKVARTCYTVRYKRRTQTSDKKGNTYMLYSEVHTTDTDIR